MNIGDVWFGFRGDATGLEVDAKKAGEAAGSTAGKSFSDKLGASMRTGLGIGAGIGVFNLMSGAVGKVTDALQASTRAAMEDETSQAKLRASLSANVKGWDGNTDAIEKVLASRMKLGFSDDAQRESLALLLAKTGDVTKALDIQRVAMDLARLKGIDLATASKAIVLGMMGQGRALKELGINVKEYTDTNEVLGAIQAKAAGQAEAYGNTTAGAMEEMQVAIDEASETIGYKLLPMLKDLAVFVRDNVIPAVEFLGNTWDFLMKLTGSEQRDALTERINAEKKAAEDATVALERAKPTMHTYSERLDDIAAGSREAAADIAKIPPPTYDARRELAKLAQGFKDTARAARDNRLDEAYDIAELPIKIRQAKREVKDAQKELEDARGAAAHDAAKLRLLEAQRDLDNLVNALADKEEGFAAVGRLLGTAYGRALFQKVAAWNRLTAAQKISLGDVPVDPRSTKPKRLAAGMPFVPYAMPAIIDYGEAVLTKAQAEEWRAGKGGSGATYQITVNNPEPRPAEPDIGRVLRRVAALGMA